MGGTPAGRYNSAGYGPEGRVLNMNTIWKTDRNTRIQFRIYQVLMLHMVFIQAMGALLIQARKIMIFHGNQLMLQMPLPDGMILIIQRLIEMVHVTLLKIPEPYQQIGKW